MFPDLPPTHEVAQAVRSPLAFLDRLADEHAAGTAAEEKAATSPAYDNGTKEAAVPGNGAPAASNGSAPFSQWSVPASGDLADDPSMN